MKWEAADKHSALTFIGGADFWCFAHGKHCAVIEMWRLIKEICEFWWFSMKAKFIVLQNSLMLMIVNLTVNISCPKRSMTCKQDLVWWISIISGSKHMCIPPFHPLDTSRMFKVFIFNFFLFKMFSMKNYYRKLLKLLHNKFSV